MIKTCIPYFLKLKCVKVCSLVGRYFYNESIVKMFFSFIVKIFLFIPSLSRLSCFFLHCQDFPVFSFIVKTILFFPSLSRLSCFFLHCQDFPVFSLHSQDFPVFSFILKTFLFFLSLSRLSCFFLHSQDFPVFSFILNTFLFFPSFSRLSYNCFSALPVSTSNSKHSSFLITNNENIYP